MICRYSSYFYGRHLCSFYISGIHVVSIYAGANSLKYFLRQIKAMDQIVENQSRKEKDDSSGAADPEGDHAMTDADSEAVGLEKKSTGGGFRPIKPNPVLLMLYGHILHCARSYVPATGMHYFIFPYGDIEERLRDY